MFARSKPLVSAMEYIEVCIQAPPTAHEILIAELSFLNFDVFEERDDALSAFVAESFFDDNAVKQVIEQYADKFALSYTFRKIPFQNWNKEWESNFEPVALDDLLYIRAPFHDHVEGYKYNITISPKMSFGTGHHPTTLLMIRLMSSLQIEGLRVLDAGTGTGILAIMAKLMGSGDVEAYDYDPICVENAAENFSLNAVSGIKLFEGKAADIRYEQAVFDIITANINRNVLLHDMPYYATWLKKGGLLLLSGFYIPDIAALEALAGTLGLQKQKDITSGEWASVQFVKE
jgi:ribosomal protein L11 methyltransferase